MTNWTYNANDYRERSFAPIPEGDHKVTIKNVTERIFNSGNEGFEITLDVAGFDSKLWYYLVFDPNDRVKTNQRIGMFFDSFAIQDHDFSHFNSWIGKGGAVRVKHNTYNGSKTANVAFCISRSQQGKLSKPQSSSSSERTLINNSNQVREFNVVNTNKPFDHKSLGTLEDRRNINFSSVKF